MPVNKLPHDPTQASGQSFRICQIRRPSRRMARRPPWIFAEKARLSLAKEPAGPAGAAVRPPGCAVGSAAWQRTLGDGSTAGGGAACASPANAVCSGIRRRVAGFMKMARTLGKARRATTYSLQLYPILRHAGRGVRSERERSDPHHVGQMVAGGFNLARDSRKMREGVLCRAAEIETHIAR